MAATILDSLIMFSLFDRLQGAKSELAGLILAQEAS
jgi:hypothetical protein